MICLMALKVNCSGTLKMKSLFFCSFAFSRRIPYRRVVFPAPAGPLSIVIIYYFFEIFP